MKRRSVKVAGYEPFALSKMIRPSCSQCRGPVQWMSLGEACDVLGFDQVNAFLGVLDLGSSDDVDLDFWRCRKCGEMGVLHGE